MKTTIFALALMTSYSVIAQSVAPAEDATRKEEATLQRDVVREDITARPNLVERVIRRDVQREVRRTDGGSGIGGGTVYEGLISWCNEVSGILQDALITGREAWGLRGEATEALALYVDGLDYALQTSGQVQTVSQTFTLRYVQRGIALSQILGVDYLINGQVIADRSTRELVTFFDWYLVNTKRMGEELDRALQIPYVSSRSCRGNQCRNIPRVSTSSLEEKTVDMTIDVLRNLQGKFARVLPDRSNMYTTIAVPTYLKALSYMLIQIAEDLRYTLYAESLGCQAIRMDQLAEQIQRYLNQRNGNALDAIRLNQFSVTLNNILRNLDTGSCH